MARLTLQPNPTFKKKVGIPVPGEEKPVDVEFTFKFRTREEMNRFAERLAAGDLSDVDLVMEMASGWELADAFTSENVALLVANYIAAPRVILSTYTDEMTKAKEKN